MVEYIYIKKGKNSLKVNRVGKIRQTNKQKKKINTHPEVASLSTSGHDGLLRQNINGGRSVDPLLRLKEPTRRGDN